jgi:hypothetical protein
MKTKKSQKNKSSKNMGNMPTRPGSNLPLIELALEPEKWEMLFRGLARSISRPVGRTKRGKVQ